LPIRPYHWMNEWLLTCRWNGEGNENGTMWSWGCIPYNTYTVTQTHPPLSPSPEEAGLGLVLSPAPVIKCQVSLSHSITQSSLSQTYTHTLTLTHTHTHTDKPLQRLLFSCVFGAGGWEQVCNIIRTVFVWFSFSYITLLCWHQAKLFCHLIVWGLVSLIVTSVECVGVGGKQVKNTLLTSISV
jgi:hypothetical protein